MARWYELMNCIGRAVVEKGPRALLGLLPFGEFAYDIAAEAIRRIRDTQTEPEMRAALQEAANAPAQEVREVAARVAAEAAADQPKEVQVQLEMYLAQVPGQVRRSLRRPADPSGRTVPPTLRLSRPEDLVALLPLRSPRFKPGDQPVGIGDWVLVELLGVGGFGEVWKARNEYLDDQIAIKFCLDAEAAIALRHEAALLGRVMRQGKHPGIVTLLDTHLTADPPCLKYEFVEGGDLAGLVKDWPRLPEGPSVAERTRLVRRLANIVTHAHSLNPPIVHRDLKPTNVLVQSTPDGLTLRVTDFGIGAIASRQALEQARQVSQRSLTLATVLRGSHSPLYASPQQARGDDADPRDDVHALGVIWYQLLAGNLSEGVPPDWRDELGEAGVEAKYLDILGACVAARPERRLASASLLLERLETVMSSAVSPKLTPTPVYLPAVKPSQVGEVTVARFGPADFRGIAEALQHVKPGTRLLVRAGRYLESLVLDRSVEIVGEGDVVVESTDSPCLTMKCDQAVVRGLTLVGRVSSPENRYFGVDIGQGRLLLEDCNISNDSLSGVGIHGASTDATLRNCKIHGCRQGGIYAYEGGRGALEGCEIHGNELAGVTVSHQANINVRNCKVWGSVRGGGLYFHERGKGTVEGCDIHTNNAAGIEIKTGADPLVQNCKIREGKGNGVLVWHGGHGTLEGCDIFGNVYASVEIKQGADPTLRRCTIHDSQQGGGVYIHENARATVEHCESYGNHAAGLEIKGNSDPVVRHCKFHNGKGNGVLVWQNGRGTIESCDIHGNLYAAIEIKLGGDPTVRHCTLRDSQKGGGLFVHENGRGTIESCDIHDNQAAGVEIKGESDPVVRGCTIHDGKVGGVFIHGQGRGTIDGCEIYGNTYSGLEIREGGDPVIRNCTIRDGRQSGVYVHDGGRGTIEYCRVVNNRGGAWSIGQGCNVVRRNNREV